MKYFKLCTANWRQETDYSAINLSLVNAVALAKDIPWEQSFRLILSQAHRYSLMPDDKRLAEEMILEAGYARCVSFKGKKTYEQLSEFLDAFTPKVTNAIVRTGRNGTSAFRFCAVRRIPEEGNAFCVLDAKEHNDDRRAVKLYLPCEETGEDKPVHGELHISHTSFKPDEDRFTYFQPNPDANCIGDCVVRAYCSFFEVGWNEALEMIARANGYNSTVINSRYTDRYLLAEKGIQSHEQIRVNGKVLTGAELCIYAERHFFRGERLLVEDHSCPHVFAIVPVEKDGTFRYLVTDTWDSSRDKAGNFWTRLPNGEIPPGMEMKTATKKSDMPPIIAEGKKIRHPRFGPGEIRHADAESGRVKVEFTSGEVKTLLASWVMENCYKDD